MKVDILMNFIREYACIKQRFNIAIFYLQHAFIVSTVALLRYGSIICLTKVDGLFDVMDWGYRVSSSSHLASKRRVYRPVISVFSLRKARGRGSGDSFLFFVIRDRAVLQEKKKLRMILMKIYCGKSNSKSGSREQKLTLKLLLLERYLPFLSVF